MKKWIAPALVMLVLLPLAAWATGTLTIPVNFGALTSPANTTLFDTAFAAVSSYINTREITQDIAANRPAAGVKGRYYFATDTLTLYNDNGASWVQMGPPVAGATAEQFTGLILSQPVSASNTLGISAGAATSDDATLTTRVLMILGSAFTKTSGAWAVGTGNGCLDTGTLAISTWYHVFVIQRLDTSVVDLLCSTSATAPIMPTNYTKKRRIGATLSDPNLAFTPAIEYAPGEFLWATPPAININQVNPGTAAVNAAVGTPLGVRTKAYLNVVMENATTATIAVYISPPDTTDSAPSVTVAPLLSIGTTSVATPARQGGQVVSWTDTSSRIRYRLSASGAGDTLRVGVIGWFDPVRN